MPRLFLIALLIIGSCCTQAQNTPVQLTQGAALLFANAKTNISPAEKNLMFQKLKLKVAADKKSFIMGDFPVTTVVYPVDMNKDGKEEIFVGLGSTALFGDIGQTFFIFIKQGTTYVQHGEISGGLPVVLTSTNLGYNDILIGGPGFEYPVLRWNGSKYALHRQMKDAALNAKNSMDVEAFSKLYTQNK